MKRITTEYIILLLFISISGYMMIKSADYSRRANIFPRLTAGATISGTILIILKNYLPSPLARIIKDSSSITDNISSDADKLKQQDSIEQRNQSGRSFSSSTFTGVAVSVAIASGYLLGLLWVMPCFVGIYTLWFRFSWHRILILSAAAFGIGYIFDYLLVLPYREGILTRGIDILWLIS
jgi:hypothetical protein